MKVKICGLTNEVDALAAVDAGADYLGFNFYHKSPRRVSPDLCVELVAAVRATGSAVVTVGIFVEQEPADVARLLNVCGLDLAQLHGGEALDRFEALRGRAFAAVRPGPGEALDYTALARFGPESPAFLMDAYVPGEFGGTGMTGDWAQAAVVARQYPIFLAGGLTPANVGAAIAAVRPWGVDVASGVESAPGVKEHGMMRAFVDRAKGYKGFEGHQGK